MFVIPSIGTLHCRRCARRGDGRARGGLLLGGRHELCLGDGRQLDDHGEKADK